MDYVEEKLKEEGKTIKDYVLDDDARKMMTSLMWNAFSRRWLDNEKAMVRSALPFRVWKSCIDRIKAIQAMVLNL
jgi:hypothetical protein